MISEVYTVLDDKGPVKVQVLGAKEDQLIIKTNYPFLGIASLRGFTITSSEGLKFEFRYSKDSIHWSEWMSLDLQNLQGIKDLRCESMTCVEYSITNISGELEWFKSIDLDVEYVEVKSPSVYKKLPFVNYFSFVNKLCLQYTANVLTKVFKKGIVPQYIKRNINYNWEDEDFINLMSSIIYIDSLKYHLGEVYREILYRPELLTHYLKQRGINPGKQKDLSVLYYLATHLFNEVRRKGTSLIFKENISLPKEYINVKFKGELLRLLNVNRSQLELDFLSGHEVGWFVGKTSPGTNNSRFSNSLLRGYEQGEDVLDIASYPLKNRSVIYKSFDKTINRYIMNIEGSSAGIMYDGDKDHLVKVNPRFGYSISMVIKAPTGSELSFGLTCYDEDERLLGRPVQINNLNQETNYFFREKKLPDNYILLEGLIFGVDSEEDINYPSILGLGRHLRFNSKEVQFICPIVNVDSLISNEVKMFNFKIRSLHAETADYLSQENLLLIKSNKEIDNATFNEIESGLIPYNSNLQLKHKEYYE